MFMGEYNHSIDAKGRMIVPAKFREQLGNEFVVTKGLDGCLFVYSNEEWHRIEENLRDKPLTSREARKFMVFYTGERPWNAGRQLSELVEVDERFESYFHDCKMNLIEIKGNTSYNFNEEDVYNLFYICRSIYDQSIYEGTSNHFGLVKSSVLKIVKTLTDVEWLDL